MIDKEYFKEIENTFFGNTIPADNTFVSDHFSTMLDLRGFIVSKGTICMNSYQVELMNHLFRICFNNDYIPSLFIKDIANISLYINEVRIIGVFPQFVKEEKVNFFINIF